MIVYLLRHGVAEDRKPGRSDAQRRLTREGIEKLRWVLETAREAGVAPDLILTSPLARALETARLAAAILKVSRLEETDALLPSASPEEIWTLLREHSDLDSVLLAGHDPSLSLTANFLLGCPRPAIEMKKGALLCLEVETKTSGPRSLLRWLLTAKLAAAGRKAQPQ